MTTTTDSDRIRVRIGDHTCELSRADAADLQEAIGDVALFVGTAFGLGWAFIQGAP